MILKITLRPTKPFFFGSEGSFKELDKNNETDERRSSYLLCSQYFPQQTSVLGLLRHQLLLQSGLLPDSTKPLDPANRKKAAVLIGPRSFHADDETQDFGAIKGISPVYLQGSDGAICVPAPLDDQLRKDGKQMVFKWENRQPLLKGFMPKEGLVLKFQHPEVSKKNANLDTLFESTTRVGILKATKPSGNLVADDQSGYYRQTFLQFAKPKQFRKPNSTDGQPPFHVAAFVCFVELNAKISDPFTGAAFKWSDGAVSENTGGLFTLQNALVEFGGERSVFQMEVVKLHDTSLPQHRPSYHHTFLDAGLESHIGRLVCLSPAYVDLQALRTHSVQVISELVSFRFMQSIVADTNSYHKESKRNDNQNVVTESGQYYLLERGSVVYFEKEKETEITKLFQHSGFEQIGYNQIAIL